MSAKLGKAYKSIGLEEALDDIKFGRIYKVADTETLFKQILGNNVERK